MVQITSQAAPTEDPKVRWPVVGTVGDFGVTGIVGVVAFVGLHRVVDLVARDGVLGLMLRSHAVQCSPDGRSFCDPAALPSISMPAATSGLRPE